MSGIKKNMLPRTCKECGNTFQGGPRAWYCPACRIERQRNQNRLFKQRKKSGEVVPIGSVISCVDCGKQFIKEGGQHVRCPECAAKHLKQIDNKQSQDWKKQNHEKYLEAKRDFSKRRHAEEGKEQPEPCIHWDKAHRKWRVVVKLKHIGYYSTEEEAKKALEEYRRNGNEKV